MTSMVFFQSAFGGTLLPTGRAEARLEGVLAEVTTRVVIAEDLDDLRWLLRNQLELDGDFRVVGEAADGVQAVEAVASTHPDVVVLDLMMPKMSGLDAAVAVSEVAPSTRIVLYSAVSEVAVAAAGRLHDAEYVRKGSSTHAIVEAVARVST